MAGITRRDLLYSTFIGLTTKIVNSSQKDLVGLKGCIVDETKNMLVLECNGRERKIQKAGCIFRFYLDNGAVDIDGTKIMFRHFERPKKAKKGAII